MIWAAELSRVNSFAYLTQLQGHAADLARALSHWLPWTYDAAPLQAGNVA